MGTAEGYGELVTDLLSEPARLGEAQVVRIARLPAADEATILTVMPDDLARRCFTGSTSLPSTQKPIVCLSVIWQQSIAASLNSSRTARQNFAAD